MTTTYNVYQDGVLVDNVPAVPAFDRVVGLADATTYLFQVGQVIDGTEVLRSNIVSITTLPAGDVDPPPPDPDPDPPPVGGGGGGDPGFTTLQAAVDAAADNDTITCPSGSTFAELVTVPPSTTGLTIDLNGSTITGSNVRKQWLIATNTVDLTVKNGTMENAKKGDNLPGDPGYVPSDPSDFQLPSFSATGATGLRLENMHLTGGAAACFGSQSGSDYELTDCEIDNARVTGVSFGGVSDALLDTCHVHHNGALGDPANEAGGVKVGNHGVGITVRNSEIDHNLGVGLWADVFAQGVDFGPTNKVHHNSVTGISFEVSGYSNDAGAFGAVSRIHHNACWENGWAGTGYPFADILVSSAANVEVDHNTTAWGRNEFNVFEQNRPIPPGNTVNFDVKSVNWHDNVHVLGTRTVVGGEYPAMAWWGRDDSGPIYTNPGNVGANNKFWSYLSDGAYGTFQWNGSGSYTIAAWNATAVGGGSSTRITSGARDTALTAAGIPLAPEAH